MDENEKLRQLLLLTMSQVKDLVSALRASAKALESVVVALADTHPDKDALIASFNKVKNLVIVDDLYSTQDDEALALRQKHQDRWLEQLRVVQRGLP